MIDKLSLPLSVNKGAAVEYFKHTTLREKALADIIGLDAKWRSLREHRNHYRDSSVKLFDAADAPISIDLHGFSTQGALIVLADFKGFIKKHKLNKFHIIYGNGQVLSNLVQEYAERELRPYFYIYEDCGHAEYCSKTGQAAWPPLATKTAAPPPAQNYGNTQKMPEHYNSLANDRQTKHAPSINVSPLDSNSRGSQKKSQEGGVFAAIGEFLKGVAVGIGEGISEAVQAAEREKERLAMQQRKYDLIYLSKRGFISKTYGKLKELFCGMHTCFFFVFMFSIPVLVPLLLFNLVADIKLLSSFFSLIENFALLLYSFVTENFFQILAFYLSLMVPGRLFENLEEKKFYSEVPRELHREVKFHFFR